MLLDSENVFGYGKDEKNFQYFAGFINLFSHWLGTM